MANTQSALKRVRQTKTRTLENRTLKTRIKTTRKAALEALSSGDSGAAEKAIRSLYSAVDRAAKSGAVHANYSRRIKANFSAKLAAVSA